MPGPLVTAEIHKLLCMKKRSDVRVKYKKVCQIAKEKSSKRSETGAPKKLYSRGNKYYPEIPGDSKVNNVVACDVYWNRLVNPLTPMSDQERISPYNLNTISSRKVVRIEKNIS